MNNTGLWHQVNSENFEKGSRFGKHHLIEVQFHLDWLHIKYTNGAIKDWEELETAINHFKLIQQWRII